MIFGAPQSVNQRPGGWGTFDPRITLWMIGTNLDLTSLGQLASSPSPCSEPPSQGWEGWMGQTTLLRLKARGRIGWDVNGMPMVPAPMSEPLPIAATRFQSRSGWRNPENTPTRRWLDLAATITIFSCGRPGAFFRGCMTYDFHSSHQVHRDSIPFQDISWHPTGPALHAVRVRGPTRSQESVPVVHRTPSVQTEASPEGLAPQFQRTRPPVTLLHPVPASSPKALQRWQVMDTGSWVAD